MTLSHLRNKLHARSYDHNVSNLHWLNTMMMVHGELRHVSPTQPHPTWGQTWVYRQHAMMTAHGKQFNVELKEQHLMQDPNYQERIETAPDASAKILTSAKVVVWRYWRGFDQVWLLQSNRRQTKIEQQAYYGFYTTSRNALHHRLRRGRRWSSDCSSQTPNVEHRMPPWARYSEGRPCPTFGGCRTMDVPISGNCRITPNLYFWIKWFGI